jgi:hypothetical protein
MAKKSSIEKNNRRKRMTKNAAPARARLKAIIAGHPDSQPLRAVRPFALGLSQEQAQPHRAA